MPMEALAVEGGAVAVDLWRSALTSLRPAPDISCHEWAEEKRRFDKGPVPGRWHSRSYQKEPLEAISDSDVEAVVFVGCSQGSGKTEIILNTCGYYMDVDPSPILIVEPDLETADALSKDRLAPMIAACPDLRAKVRDPRARDSGNTIRHKMFDGGEVTLVGSNSASGLSMRPKRIVLFDEIGRYKDSAGTEGDAIRLAEARTLAYAVLGLAKRVYVSSPAIRKTCRLWRLWKQTDQCEFFVDCFDCGGEQFFDWNQVKWDKDKDGGHLPETAYYCCEHCGAHWDDVARFAAIEGGRYKPTAENSRRMRGFRLPAMAVIGLELQKLVEEFLDSKGNPEELKAFINTKLADWWDEGGESLGESAFLEEGRRENFAALCPARTQVPAEVAVLTMGVDFQASPPRVEYEIVGWGRGEESWSLQYGRIYGDIRSDPGVFADLEKILLAPLIHAKGFPMYIRAACLDSGYATNAVYKFCRPRLRRPLPNGQPQFVFAIKGRSEEGRPIWPESPGTKRKKGIGGRINMWTIGTDAAKDQVMGRLGIVEPGPGYCHFPLDRGVEYFKGLTAEEVTPRRRGGKIRRVWELKKAGQANEPFDCRCYAYAGMVALQLRPFLLDLDKECDGIESLPFSDVSKNGATGSVVAPRRRVRRPRSPGFEA